MAQTERIQVIAALFNKHDDPDVTTGRRWLDVMVGWISDRPLLADGMLALAVSALLLITEATDAGEVGATLDWVDLLVCIGASGLIVARRLAPLPVFAVALGGAIWSLLPDVDQVVLRVAAVLALYTVSVTQPRRVSWCCGVVSAIVLFLTAVATNPGSWFAADNLQHLAWMGAAVAAGDAVRSRRAFLIARDERAMAIQARIDQEREDEAQRRVIEERLHIARELHDVVAHHIAVVNVQAGVAQHLLRSNPDGAEVALGHVRTRSRVVLDELSGMLSSMRTGDARSASPEPLPTLAQLGTLVEDFGASGLKVQLTVDGEIESIGSATGLTAYRIVQEGLTNAHRHGADGLASLRVVRTPDLLKIIIENKIGQDASESDRGHGIIGMRERVAAAGGSLATGSDHDGIFRVHVELPTSGVTNV